MIINMSWEYLKPYNFVLIICIRLEFFIQLLKKTLKKLLNKKCIYKR